MKKFLIAGGVLAVAVLVGYSGTTAVLNSNMKALVPGTDVGGMSLPDPSPINSKAPSRCPDCSLKERALNEEINRLKEMAGIPVAPGVGYNSAQEKVNDIEAAAKRIKEAQEALARCNELKKAYCEGMEDGKAKNQSPAKRSSNQKRSSPSVVR